MLFQISEGDHWILGVVLGLAGSVAINSGNNIQSLGLKQLQRRAERIRKSPSTTAPAPADGGINTSRRATLDVLATPLSPVALDLNKNIAGNKTAKQSPATPVAVAVAAASPASSGTWIVGTIIFLSGSLLNFASYAFAAQSMLASLESIQFITNLLFGRFLLGAKVTKGMVFGCTCTVLGTVLAVQFSSKDTLQLNTLEMKRLYLNPVYVAYLVFMGVLLVSLSFIYNMYERFHKKGTPLRYTSTVMSLTYSAWSAIFGTQSVVQAKVLAELLAVYSSGEENIWQSWFTYITIALWVVTVGIWLKRLNDALAKFDPLFIIPMLQCSFIFFAIVSGGIFFQEFNSFTIADWCGFGSGVCVMFIGLALLTPADRKVQDKHILEASNKRIKNTITTRDSRIYPSKRSGPMAMPTINEAVDSDNELPSVV